MYQAVSEPGVDFSNPALWVPAYLPLIKRKERRKILYGSRDSAKSYFIAQRIIIRMLREKCKGMMVRKRHNSIQESQWQTIKDIVELYQLQEYFVFRKAPLEIECTVTGSRLIARGMDDAGKAKSIPGIDFVWYEEADELDLEDFTQTTLSIRGRNIEEWISFNSTYPEHWLLSRFFPGTHDQDGNFTVDLSFEDPTGMFTWVTSTDPTAVIMHTCYQHNPFCTEDRRREHEWYRDHLPEHYRTKGLGLIGRRNIGTLWAKGWDRKKHMPLGGVQVDHGYPHHLTFDQNSLPYSTLVCAQIIPDGNRKKVRFFREYCLKPPKNSTENTCNAWIWEYGDHNPREYHYGDPTGKNEMARKEIKEARHHYAVVDRTLEPFSMPGANRVGRKAPSIAGRQHFMQVVLNGGTFIDIEVDPSCVNVIGDFEHLVEDENGGYVKKRITDKETGQSWEERGHCMDAIINFMAQAFPDLYKHVAKA